jgi:glyoxylase-like metal-dependent hydrolase (beta-lactamase superfamily II)
MCPWARRLINGDGNLLAPGRIVCHVLLIELDGGLVLVDTGFGTDDVRDPRRGLSLPFTAMMRPRLDVADTAIEQVRALGFDPAEVRDIIVTHLDVDHAGGLPDFPHATVHLFGREHETMLHPPLREQVRYRIGATHWAHGPRWATYQVGGDRWHGFDSVRVLPGSDAEMLLIPLPGHTLGHTGVAIRREDKWLLHCGDAYFHRDEMRTPPSCPPALRAFQNVVQANGRLRRENQERLRELAARDAGEVELICAHDPVLLDQCSSGRTATR